MNARRITRMAAIALVVSFSIIILAMTIDWLTKYTIYVQQRDVLYDLIRDSPDHEQIESMKKTVSYLQGTATRRVNEIKETSIYFALTFAVYAWLWRMVNEKEGKKIEVHHRSHTEKHTE